MGGQDPGTPASAAQPRGVVTAGSSEPSPRATYAPSPVKRFPKKHASENW